jgi:DNA invertase Pin-like site-specific DNA recombinase
MIAAIYAHKNTHDSDRNEEARSTTRQVERATEYALAKGWTLDPRHVYVDDAVSGAEWKHRPGFNALLAACEPRPPFGVLVVSELSRIGRDTVRTPGAILQLEEEGRLVCTPFEDAEARGYHFTATGTYRRLGVPDAVSVGGGPKGLGSPADSRSACRWPGGWN